MLWVFKFRSCPLGGPHINYLLGQKPVWIGTSRLSLADQNSLCFAVNF